MNLAVVLVALVAACNAPRRRASLSVADTRMVSSGAILAAALFVIVAAIATPALDALDISAPNVRIAVGLVLAPVAVLELVRRAPRAGAALPGTRAALVPVFFPVLARPDVALLALAAGADLGVAWTALGAVLAFASVVAWHRVATPHATSAVFLRVEDGLGRVVSVATVALAAAILIDGVFAI